MTGAGVARDLALRGLSVLLLEKDDWGWAGGASGWTLGDGAWRRLESDRAAAAETGHLARIARHLVRRCATLVPVLPDDRVGIERLEAVMEVHDRLQPLRALRPHLRLTGDEARRLEPGLSPAVTAALAVEDWTVEPHRLVWANVLDAVRAGARALNHTEVESLLRDAGGVIGVRCRAADGQRLDARARMVVNAAGPWAPRVAAMAGGSSVRLRPVRTVQVVYDRRVGSFAIACPALDGRQVALVPFGDATFLGGRNDDYLGDLDVVEVRPDDVDWLLQAAKRVLPGIGDHRPVRAGASVVATPSAWGEPADDLTARFEVLDHERLDGVPGLVTVAGGALPLYRLLAERAADAVCTRLGVQTRSTTASRPLPGASGTPPPVHELTAEHGLSALAATRLLARHGTEAPDVLQDARRGRLVCRCEALTEAELAHAVRHEHVRTLADAFRRVGLAAGPCAGTACVERAAEVMGHELDWSAAQRREAARDFQVVAWRDRAPVLDRWGWAQEELTYGLRRGWPGTL